uniref:KAT8 regulatory NSL complex subunit 3 n=1 Tax=Parascaris univalens TaxID=6257 RepID=A0A915BU82_PARUN
MSSGMSEWHSATDLYKAMDRLGGDQLFETIDARQRELDDMHKMSGATTLDRSMRASSFFDRSTTSSNRFERGHSVARLDVNDTKGRPGSSNWSRRTRSSSVSLPRSATKRGRSEDFSSSTRGNLTPQLKVVKLDNADTTSRSSSVAQSPTLDDGVFVKPTMPSITRLKPPRIYSSEPISRSRLTIPKRRFSPEPESKYAKVLPGLRRPAIEIVELAELKRIIRMTPLTEFDLPINFTPKQKKRVSLTTDVTSIVTTPALQHVETVEFSLPISFIRECTRARSLGRTPAGPSSRKTTRLSSQTPEDLESRIATRSSNRKLMKDGKDTANEELFEHQTRALSQGTSFAEHSGSSETTSEDAREDYATAGSSKAAVRSRLARKSAQEKEVNQTKVTAEKETSNAESGTKEEIAEECKVKEEVNDDEDMREMAPQVEELSRGEKEEAERTKEEESVEMISNSAVGGSLEVGLTGEEEERRGGSEDGYLSGAAGASRHNLSLSEDDDEEATLHIVESAEEDEVTASSEERVIYDSDQQTSNEDHEASKEECTFNCAKMVLDEILDEICGRIDERTDIMSRGLITEPLRRPGERRIVPPLRIRLPQPRNVRERKPARSKDYSPPGWSGGRQKIETALIDVHVSPKRITHYEYRTRRSSRLVESLSNALTEVATSSSYSRSPLFDESPRIASQKGFLSSAKKTSRGRKKGAMSIGSRQRMSSGATRSVSVLQSLEEVSLRMVTPSASTSPGLTCCTETIEALLKESEDLIADLSSLASQISPQSEESLERSSDKSIISSEERLRSQDGPFTKEVQQEEISFESSFFTDDEQKSVDLQETAAKNDENVSAELSKSNCGTTSNSRQSRGKTLPYAEMFPELFPSKRRKRSAKRAQEQSSYISEPIVPIPFEEEVAAKDGKKKVDGANEDYTSVLNLTSSKTESMSEMQRPGYNEMADSPMLSARERKLRREARSMIPLKASVERMTSYPSCTQTDDIVEEADEKLTDDEVAEDESALWVPRGRDPSVSERKTRRLTEPTKSSPAAHLRNVSRGAHGHGLRAKSTAFAEKPQLTIVTRSRAHGGSLVDSSQANVAQQIKIEGTQDPASAVESKEQSSQRRIRSKGVAHESAGRGDVAVSSVDLMPAAAKLSKRARRGSSAAVIANETDEQLSTENEPKKGVDEVTGDVAEKLKTKRDESDSQRELAAKNRAAPPRMPYFKRISLRRKLNPLAIGLKSRMDDDERSDFYREILLRGEEIRIADEKEIDVDIETVAQVEDDETIAPNPATEIAASINEISPRPTHIDEETGETVEDGIADIQQLVTKESEERRVVASKMLDVILAEYAAELATEHVIGSASIQYNIMVKNSYRLKDSIPIFTKEKRNTAKWAHKMLIERLPLPILATYVNMLRFCRTTGRSLIDLLVREETSDNKLKTMNSRIAEFIFVKVREPQTAAISRTLNKRRIECVYVIAVSPSISYADCHSKERSHEYMFKTLLPNVVGKVEQLRITLPMNSKFSACEVAEFAIDTVAKKVTEVRRQHPDMRIVLAGWGTSCVINHQVVNVVSNVSAILNFAFPLKTAEGMRGDVDDDILLTYCPSLFIVGEEAIDCDVREIQRMAYRMKTPAGVIVIGSADSNLHVSILRLCVERFTQRTVERALLDDIVDFLERYCSRSVKNVRPLRPILPYDTNDVDLSIFKASSNSNFSPRYVPVKQKRELELERLSMKKLFVDCGDEKRVFKRPHSAETIVVEATGSAFQDNMSSTITNISREVLSEDTSALEPIKEPSSSSAVPTSS